MLCQFSFRNFKSFREEAVLDLQASPNPEFRETLINGEHTADLLPVGVIYGPNGGGKSNLLEALSCMVFTIVNPVHQLKKNRLAPVLQQKAAAVPFLFDRVSADEPSEFQVLLRTAANEYRYRISLKDNEVISESLTRRSVTGRMTAVLFQREAGSITLGPSIKKKSISIKTNPKIPYLSFLAIHYDIPAICEVMTCFEGCIIRSYAFPVAEYQILTAEESHLKNAFLRALNDMGTGITDYRYDENSHQFYLKRTIGSAEYEIPFSEESNGIRKLIAALPAIQLALREGRLIIIDDLDAKLHPENLQYIVSLFTNRETNPHGAQLLFTANDMNALKGSMLRRDEIWLAAENDTHESRICSFRRKRAREICF